MIHFDPVAVLLSAWRALPGDPAARDRDAAALSLVTDPERAARAPLIIRRLAWARLAALRAERLAATAKARARPGDVA